jgi:hypothetical protein
MISEYRIVESAIRGPIGEPKVYSEREKQIENEDPEI